MITEFVLGGIRTCSLHQRQQPLCGIFHCLEWSTQGSVAKGVKLVVYFRQIRGALKIVLKFITNLLEVLVLEFAYRLHEAKIYRLAVIVFLENIPFLARFPSPVHQYVYPMHHTLRRLLLLNIVQRGVNAHLCEILGIKFNGV